MHTITSRVLSRRVFLRAAASRCSAVSGCNGGRGRWAAAAPRPKRMICICATLGIHGPLLFPAESGRNYKDTPYLEH